MKKLVGELGAAFVSPRGRTGLAVHFRCPCCLNTERATRLLVPFKNPIDGGLPDPQMSPAGNLWSRQGSTLETLTLAPIVDYSGYGHWRGAIRNGYAVKG